MRINLLLGFVSIAMLVMPRVEATYPLYILASILILDLTRSGTQAFLTMAALVAAFSFAFILNTFVFDVSTTAYLLQLILLAPFLLFISGFQSRLTIQETVQFSRWLNMLIMMLSLAHMAIYYNFPFQLPHLDFTPDAFSAFYYKGGAKIVTVIGLFGLMIELFTNQKIGRETYFFTAICLVNFLMPSYIIGILCGFAAIALVSFNLKQLGFGLVGLAAGLFLFLGDRWANIATSWEVDWGMPPKIYAFVIVWDHIVYHPVILLVGTGLGQFTGEAAIWASSYLSEFTRAGDIPGLFMSQHHDEAFGVISQIWIYDFWSLSSSANKPYGSISTLIAEAGLPLFVFLCALTYLRIRPLEQPYRKFRMVLFAAIGALLLVDSWADQPWFSYLLILCTPFLKSATSRVNTKSPVPLPGPLLPEALSAMSDPGEQFSYVEPVLVDLNVAAVDEMVENLTGIGPERASAIVLHRGTYGYFGKIEDLLEVKGMPVWVLERNRKRLKISQPIGFGFEPEKS